MDEGHQGIHRVDIRGNAQGPVIAGDYNVVVDAQGGSTVTLLVERERPVPMRRDRVALLPRQQGELVGRDAESVALTEAIRAGGPVQLCGPAGVGKSALLRHAARSVEPGPDGVVYLTAAHGDVGDLAQGIFEACYDAVGYAPSSTELRRLMTGVRVTVYIDNADLTLEQIRELTDSAPDATFVFASPDRSLLGDGTVLELEGLDHTAGLRLLTSELRRPLEEGELGTATDLWQVADGRPLLLLRAAGLARGGPGLPPPGSITELLPLLLWQLDDTAMNVLHLLATLDDIELDPVHIGALTGVLEPAILCDHLTGLGLTVTSERGTRCLPDTVSEVRQRKPSPFPAAALCTYFVSWATQPTTTPADVAVCGPALEKIAELGEWAGHPELAVKVARAASPRLAQSLRFGAWGRLLGRGWNAAQRTGDKPAAAYFMHEEGIRSLLTGRRIVAAALVAEAAVLWHQLGNVHGATSALHAQHYVPPATHTIATPAANSGTAATGHSATTGQAATGHAATGHTATAGHAATGQNAAAGHATAGHSATAGHVTAAHGGTSQTAASHMAQLGHSSAGHTATAHAHHSLGHAATAHAHHGLGHAAAAHAQHAGHLSGMASAGTAHAGTAVVVGKGISMITLLLIGAAVVGAAVIGGIALTSGDDNPQTGIVGTWTNGTSSVTIDTDGPGSYIAHDTNTICGSFDVQLKGNDSSASGNGPLFYIDDKGSCSRVGQVSVTITASPGGGTVDVVTAKPSDQTRQCLTCGTITLTRR